MRPARPALAASLLLALAGCGADATGDATVARDSAGIRIIENPAPDGRTALVLEPEPAVSIGALDGPAEYTFQSVRDAARLEDGGIVVADGSELRYYDADGAHLRTAGGAGEGPGEFSFLNAVVVCGGEVIAGDLRQQRLTVFDMEGSFLRVESIPASGSMVFSQSLESCDDAGRPVLRSPTPFNPTDTSEAGAAASPVTPILRADLAADRVDTIARVPARPVPPRVGSPLDPAERYAFEPTAVHALDTESIEVRSFGPDGELRRIARVAHTPREVSGADNRRAIDARIEQLPVPPSPEVADQLRRQMAEAPAPAHMPAVRSFEADDAGRLWIQPFTVPWEDPATGWLVLDADGVYVGTAELPAGFRPLDIGDDWILGVWQDELDVAYVRLYRFMAQ